MSFFERPPVKLYLVRHGQSEANVDHNIYRTVADHGIALTAHGQSQASEAGLFLKSELEQTAPRVITLRSPYRRTRETEAAINEHISPFVDERIELVEMAEQQLGVFDGVPNDERAQQFPEQYRRFMMMHDFSGRFWARPPQGDSPYDVYLRANTVTGLIRFAAKRLKIDHFVLVAHGTWIPCFLMAWCNLPFEWYDSAPMMKNAEIIKVEGQKIVGTVFQPTSPTAEAPHTPTPAV